MAFPSTSNPFALKRTTPLQLLVEEINFQRQKEMRQLLKDDSDFVMLQGTTWWTDLFVRHFLFQSERDARDCDDLLFFVRKKHVRGSSRHAPKFDTEIEVFRKDSKKLPIGDPDVDWEETVYLNLIIHQFEYTLTLAICTRTSPKELQVLRRHSQKVYASPSRRKMDTKGESEEITYPHICFMIDNFDEVFHDITVRDGEMVCVELVAKDRDGTVQGVIFLGSIRYDALKKVYDARQSSLSSKVAQRMTFGFFSGGGPQTRCEFVRMKGPQGKGHAEMAVTKPKGSGVETPTSEPGFCATDMWDSEWEEDIDDDYYRRQRRLSDPSSNLNYFANKYAWRAKASNDQTFGSSKARSEQEGLDCLASEVAEIESGDLRDDRPASQVTTKSTSKTFYRHKTSQPPCDLDKKIKTRLSDDKVRRHPTKNSIESNKTETQTPAVINNDKLKGDKLEQAAKEAKEVSPPASENCCECFPSPQKKWSDKSSAQMSDIYSPETDHLDKPDFSSPACLATMSKSPVLKHRNLLTIDSEIEFPGSNHKKKSSPKKSPRKEKKSPKKQSKVKKTVNGNSLNRDRDRKYELADEAEDAIEMASQNLMCTSMPPALLKHSIRVNGKEEFPEEIRELAVFAQNRSLQSSRENIAPHHQKNGTRMKSHSIAEVHKTPSPRNIPHRGIQRFFTYRGKQKSPVKSPARSPENKTEVEPSKIKISKVRSYETSFTEPRDCEFKAALDSAYSKEITVEDVNANREIKVERNYATLPRVKKSHFHPSILYSRETNRTPFKVPKRTTPDGTTIYYWCNVPKSKIKELDDGAYNPLWTSRGFTQTFHFWKENRRQQSTPLNAFLTYVTLPWWSIAKDLLDHRETPILTF